MTHKTDHENQLAEFAGEILTPDTITRELRTYVRQRPRRVPLKTVAKMAGVHVDTITNIIKTGFMQESTAIKLSPVLKAIMARKLIFRKQLWTPIMFRNSRAETGDSQNALDLVLQPAE